MAAVRWWVRRAPMVLAWVGLAGLAGAQDPLPQWRIRELKVSTRDVFSTRQADESWIYDAFNALHVTTKEDVIRTESWFHEGDLVTAAEVEEFERNLRDFGLFGEVEAELVPTGEPGVADVVVRTRDRFSLVFNATAAFVGGVTQFNGALGDGNLLGLGKRAVVRGRRNDQGEWSASVTWSDPQWFDTWHRLQVDAGLTDEGHFATVAITRPFHHLKDPWSYGAVIESEAQDLDYFLSGDTAAEVPIDRNALRLFGQRGFGPRDERGGLGLEMRLERAEFEPAFGAYAPVIAVPGDTTTVSVGPFASFDWAERYLKVTGIDTLDYVQDLELGVQGRLGVGLLLRDEDDYASQGQPYASASVRAAFEPFDDTYVTMAAAGSGRVFASELQGWRLASALHVFQTSLPAQTLALSLAYEGGDELQGLKPQFTLGEDNGLRGYPAREFAGDHTVRLNVEDRIDTGLELLSTRIGLAAFFDSAWIEGGLRDLSMREAITSAGVGIRLGSSELFGGTILRFDFAFPLVDVQGQSYGFSPSFAIGQVFTFYGNSAQLRREF